MMLSRDPILTPKASVKQYNTYNAYIYCGFGITETTRYSGNHNALIEWE